ncbi:type II toxin-antitoxin system RelE family toxin [Dethiothermospora halolimnae]|uniref:type II toxin-antitoxin system RelE family toxin n=1 Tax=Dethiothermospora halolimnae TaxID=3114390 RepID=UPI003CCBCD33
MEKWEVKFIEEAVKDLKGLDGSVKKIVLAGINKVSYNPLPKSKGGLGKPLGSKNNNNLTGFFKIKYRKINIRVVYTLVRDKHIMNIVVIDKRGDNKCYNATNKRKEQYGKSIFKDNF